MARQASAAGAKEALTAIALRGARWGRSGAMFRTLAFRRFPARRRARLGAGRAAADAPLDEAQPVGATGAFDVSGELNLMSDYRFRGVSRSDEDPAVQAGLIGQPRQRPLCRRARHHPARASTASACAIRPSATSATSQLDLYAGFRRDLGDGFEVDGGLMYYVFAGGDGATDYVEPYASLSYLIGPVYATAGAKYAPSQAAIGDEDMLYLFGQVDVTMPFRPWSLQRCRPAARIGAGSAATGPGRSAASITSSSKALPNTEIGLRYVDTDLPGLPGQDAGVVLSVEIGF